MELILTILALGIVFGRTSDEKEECLIKAFLGLFLFDLLDGDDDEVEDYEEDYEEDDDVV